MPVGKPSKFNTGLRIARKIGKKLPGNYDWDQARDFIDTATNGNYDAWSLDKMTDAAIKARDAEHV